jgi:hypothetical protein
MRLEMQKYLGDGINDNVFPDSDEESKQEPPRTATMSTTSAQE